jgi:hypothetical protein
MEYRWEDLPAYGVVLVPPSSPEYAGFLADIQKRLETPIPGSAPQFDFGDDPSAPTMILCNCSQTPIAALSWIWKFETDAGRPSGTSVLVSGNPSVLTPFGLDEYTRTLYAYWHVILPGSKRFIRGSRMFGDNTDVRPPHPDELWKGGSVFGAVGGTRRLVGPLKSVTLALDGVFFLDGSFAGPDALYNFDRVTAYVEAHLQVAKIARDGHNQGLSPAVIFPRIEAVTGPDRGLPPPPPPQGEKEDFLQVSMRRLASEISMMRQNGVGDDRVIYLLMSWTETPLPNFHKL